MEFIIRLISEQVELQNRIIKLKDFLSIGLGSKPEFDKVQKGLLVEQLQHMQAYESVLAKRIALLSSDATNLD